MSLAFAGICPHAPIIIPNVGKENIASVKKTIRAITKLAKDFQASSPEIIIIISPHGALFENAFSINYSEEYIGSFQQFGDFNTNLEFSPDIKFLHKLKERLEHQLPTILVQEKKLDHGVSVPLYFLTKKIKPNIVPVGYSMLDFEKHLEFGRLIKEEIMNSEKKIGVIASGDLSHRLSSEAPAGYSPLGEIFDQKIIKLLQKKDIKGILEMDKNLIDQAGECGLRSFLIMLGVLEETNCQPKKYSYESPFGVGYLVMNFGL